jgi:gliding motility-associated protein GldM
MPPSNAPETTRQRMIGLLYIMLLCMLALNVSSDVLGGFELVEDSLLKSTHNSSIQNKSLYDDLYASYLQNPEKSGEWYQRAQEVKQSADSMYNYVEEIKWEIVRKADGKKADIHNVIKREDVNSTAFVMLPPTGKKGRELAQEMETFREKMVSMVGDTLKQQLILDNFSTTPSQKDRIQGKSWETAMFDNMPVSAVITMLSKLQNDIRHAEGEVLYTLTKNIDVGDFRVNRIKAYVIPNSQNIVRGGSYRANIVLSAEDSTQRPQVYINGEALPSSQNGLYEVYANRIGTFPVAGHIELQHGDGSKRRYEFSEEFTVVEPTATVSNIMMNVLYAGIENELSISVPGVASQDISASVNNGRLSRAGNVWRALPTEVGKECIVSVNAVMDGRSQQVARVPFRVRPLPEPRAFIEYTDENNITRKYRGGEPFAKSRIMDAPGVIAALDDDLLDVPFNVLSFETLIYDSMGNTNVEISEGANFSNRQKSQIRRLTRGQRFFIARIKVVGPDKIEQTLSPMEIIIN